MSLKANILIAEDEYIIALDIKNILKKNGYSVCGTAGSGEDALKKAEVKKPDLVIFDVDIKGEMKGITVAEIINSKYNIPVLFVTGLDESETRTMIKNIKKCEFISKPFEEAYLCKTIDELLKK